MNRASHTEPDKPAPPRAKKSEVRQKRLTPEERRQDFVDKAVEFFSEVGFDGGTRELARRLGVTQPLLYRYFPTKADLIREVYDQVYVNRWKPEWDGLLTDRSIPLRRRLQSFYEAYTDAIFTREWIRIYLFSGLKGVEINKWYVKIVEDRILKRIVTEYRAEAGLPAVAEPSPAEIELAWTLHGGIFYYGLRKHIYELPVMENKNRMISNALDVFLEGAAHMFGAGVKVRSTRIRPQNWVDDLG